MGRYSELHRRSLEDPGGFWGEASERLDWWRPFDTVLDDSRPPFYRWFTGGGLNICHNAVDRQVEAGRGEHTALIHDSPITGSGSSLTFRELRDLVARFAGVLRDEGVARGDRVVVYMPMVTEAVVTMLACARIGAIHSVVFGGFAAAELAARIDDAEPKLVVSASCGYEPGRVVDYYALLNRSLALADTPPPRCVILQRTADPVELDPQRDLDWHEVTAGAAPADCVEVEATDPLYILYTSGTTGRPKGVVRDHGGYAVALSWSMEYVYGLAPGEVYWAASDIGWVVGHSYTVYGPLLHGCATVLYEGKPVGTPDAGAFWRVVEEHGVAVLFAAPTALRAIRGQDPDARLIRARDTSTLRTLFVAGERCDVDTLRWCREHLGLAVVNHWWQTETGWPMSANPVGVESLAVPDGSIGRPMPGYDIRILDTHGAEQPPRSSGEIVVRLPLPPAGCLTLWGDDEGFVNSYLERYPGFYRTGDAGFFDDEGYLHILGRVDDVVNVAGHRLSTGGIENVVSAHPDVAEAAVVGVPDDLKGEVPLCVLVLQAGTTCDVDRVIAEVVAKVREEIGPVAALKSGVVVSGLPKTRSGKVLRSCIRSLAAGEQVTVPPTIEDPDAIDEVAEALRRIGLPPAGGTAARR